MTNKFAIITIEAGDTVLCDLCNTDYTSSNECGGLIFCSNAVCPECESQLLAEATTHGEQKFIRARCPENQSFADFVRQYRKGQ